MQLGRLLLASPQRSVQDWLRAIAWLKLAENHQITGVQAALEPERAKLTPEQTKQVEKLKPQLESKQ